MTGRGSGAGCAERGDLQHRRHADAVVGRARPDRRAVVMRVEQDVPCRSRGPIVATTLRTRAQLTPRDLDSRCRRAASRTRGLEAHRRSSAISRSRTAIVGGGVGRMRALVAEDAREPGLGAAARRIRPAAECARARRRRDQQRLQRHHRDQQQRKAAASQHRQSRRIFPPPAPRFAGKPYRFRGALAIGAAARLGSQAEE